MSKEIKLSNKENIDKRYSEIDLDIDKINSIRFNTDTDFYDYMFSVVKTFTEVEQDIIEILYISNEAITMSQIRNLFTQAYLERIFNILQTKKNLVSDSRIVYLTKFYLETNPPALVSYPNSITFTLSDIENFTLNFFPQIKAIEETGLNRFFFEQKVNSNLGKTETQRFERARKILSKYGFVVPSGELIKNSLEFLKEKKLVNFRIQNNNYLWFLEPKFTMLMRKFEKKKGQEEKSNKQTEITLAGLKSDKNSPKVSKPVKFELDCSRNTH